MDVLERLMRGVSCGIPRGVIIGRKASEKYHTRFHTLVNPHRFLKWGGPTTATTKETYVEPPVDYKNVLLESMCMFQPHDVDIMSSNESRVTCRVVVGNNMEEWSKLNGTVFTRTGSDVSFVAVGAPHIRMVPLRIKTKTGSMELVGWRICNVPNMDEEDVYGGWPRMSPFVPWGQRTEMSPTMPWCWDRSRWEVVELPKQINVQHVYAGRLDGFAVHLVSRGAQGVIIRQAMLQARDELTSWPYSFSIKWQSSERLIVDDWIAHPGGLHRNGAPVYVHDKVHCVWMTVSHHGYWSIHASPHSVDITCTDAGANVACSCGEHSKDNVTFWQNVHWHETTRQCDNGRKSSPCYCPPTWYLHRNSRKRWGNPWEMATWTSGEVFRNGLGRTKSSHFGKLIKGMIVSGPLKHFVGSNNNSHGSFFRESGVRVPRQLFHSQTTGVLQGVTIVPSRVRPWFCMFALCNCRSDNSLPNELISLVVSFVELRYFCL